MFNWAWVHGEHACHSCRLSDSGCRLFCKTEQQSYTFDCGAYNTRRTTQGGVILHWHCRWSSGPLELALPVLA